MYLKEYLNNFYLNKALKYILFLFKIIVDYF